MARRGKTFRGQRKDRIKGCGCYYCCGFDKHDRYRLKEMISDIETFKYI